MTGPFDPTDWITIWQSELAARAVDREAHEFIAQQAQTWTQLSHDFALSRNDGAAGLAGADASPRPAPAGAAPDAVRDGLEQLRRQFEALQRGPGA